MLPLWVAKERGFFDKHGVDVEVMYVRGVSVEALLAGEVQFIRASPPSVVRSTLKGADLAVIANTINVPVFSLNDKTRDQETGGSHRAEKSALPIWATPRISFSA